MAGWNRSFSNITTQCVNPDCGVRFVSRFHVILDKGNSTFEIEYYSPPALYYEIENLIYLNGEDILTTKDFCDKYATMFWNIAKWYNFMKLPHFFLNPTF